MLSQEDLQKLFIQQNVPLEGRRVVATIRSADPERRVRSGTHNVASRFASYKMGLVIQAESHKNELPALYLWEHDAETHEFYDQPSTIKLSYKSSSGKRVTHLSVPDFFLIQETWMGWVECKTEDWLLQEHAKGSGRFVPDGDGGWRCSSGEEYAAQYGLGFKVRSSKENNWALVRNIEFLADYFRASCTAPTEPEIALIRDLFTDERWILLQDLLEHEGVPSDAVYKLIADGRLFADLESELLTERNYTAICRDAESLDIYVMQKTARVTMPAVRKSSIKLEPQSQIVWDGNPWTIVNVGAAKICLMSADKVIVNISLEQFQTLVEHGTIAGLLEQEDLHALAYKIVKGAADIDLVVASMRMDALSKAEKGVAVVPERTLRYWKRQAEEGAQALGNRFAGLIPRISARGNRNRKLPEDVLQTMRQVILEKVLTADKPNIFVCYGSLVNVCNEKGIVCPSEKTFRSEIKKIRRDRRIIAREGEKAAYAATEWYWNIDQSTPRHGERPFEIGHIDHTLLDVELVDQDTGANLGRPWLTFLIDAYSRMILAFYITFDSPSYRSCMAIIRECIRRHGRIPRTIVVDQGSDFESKYFEVLLARLETHKKSRPAAKARFGSVIERVFGIANQTFIHNLAGNTQASRNPRSMSATHDPKRRAAWTLSALNNAFECYVDKHYGHWRHSGIGMSPQEALAHGMALSGNRGHVLIPYTEDFQFLCLPSTDKGTAKVYSGRGFRINGIDYWNSAFREICEEKNVPVRYDPFDISKSYAMVRGEWLLCRSKYQAKLERRTEREIAIISQEIRALHMQRDIHRRKKASDVASFVDEMKKSEALLLQQRRDAQRRENARQPEPKPELLSLDTKDECQDDPWAAEDELEVFGEFK